jgi:transposase InsO family protein
MRKESHLSAHGGARIVCSTETALRPQTTQSRHAEPIAPNHLKELHEGPQRPNQVWTADLTYIPTQEEGWLYFAAEMDLCSKRIAGWNLDDSLAARWLLRPSSGPSDAGRLLKCIISSKWE